MPADPRSLLQALQPRLPEMIVSIRELVEMESPSFSKAEVDHLGRALARKFELVGGRTRFHRAKEFGDHLEVTFPGARGRKPVMLLGHHDTVYDLGTLATMPFRSTRGRLFG